MSHELIISIEVVESKSLFFVSFFYSQKQHLLDLFCF